MLAGFRKDGSIDLRRLPKIIERPLRRHGADGLATHLLYTEPGEKAPDEPVIEIDTGLEGRVRLETILHEALHLALPALPEEAVLKVGRYLAMVTWHMGYRRDDERTDDD
jgi:hypothetical protein